MIPSIDRQVNEITSTSAMLIECPVCKSQISNKAASCPKCGHPIIIQTRNEIVKPLKSRSLAILLALLLGGIGAHKFYLDKPGAGVLYLIFVWTFIPAIFGLIEAIQYGLMNDEVFQQKYLDKKL